MWSLSIAISGKLNKLLGVVMMSFFKFGVKRMEYKNKIYILIFLFLSLLNSAFVEACMCSSKEDDIHAIYNKSEGIYLAVISGISLGVKKNHGNEVNLELTVLKVFKGKPTLKLEAIGYGKLPVANEKGEIINSKTSCDMRYIFGSQYIVVVFSGKKMCWRSVAIALLDLITGNL